MSCGQIALERAKIPIYSYFASEIDKYAIQTTKKNYPNTIQLGDVTKWKDWDLPEINLLIGGSPCQGFSLAGKQLNFSDPRSKLFFEFVDILKELNPKYFLLENVKMKKEYQDLISEYLGVEPIQINSSLVSAHNRVRLYWTNIPGIEQPHDKGILLQDILENGFVDRKKSYCIDANYYKGGNLKQYFEKSRRQLVFKTPYIDKNNPNLPYRLLTPTECERLQTVPEGYTEGVSNAQRYKMLGNGWTVEVITHLYKSLLANEIHTFDSINDYLQTEQNTYNTIVENQKIHKIY